MLLKGGLTKLERRQNRASQSGDCWISPFPTWVSAIRVQAQKLCLISHEAACTQGRDVLPPGALVETGQYWFRARPTGCLPAWSCPGCSQSCLTCWEKESSGHLYCPQPTITMTVPRAWRRGLRGVWWPGAPLETFHCWLGPVLGQSAMINEYVIER